MMFCLGGWLNSSLPCGVGENTDKEMHRLFINACKNGDYQVVREICQKYSLPPAPSPASSGSSGSVGSDLVASLHYQFNHTNGVHVIENSSKRGRVLRMHIHDTQNQNVILNVSNYDAIVGGIGGPTSILEEPITIPDFKEENGEYPIHICVKYSQDECVELLVEAGVNMLECNSRGQLPIHIAATILQNSKKIMKHLLMVSKKSILSNHLKHIESQMKQPQQLNNFHSIEQLKLSLLFSNEVLDNITKINEKQLTAQDKDGNTALHLLSLSFNVKAFSFIMHYFSDLIDINITNSRGDSVLLLLLKLLASELIAGSLSPELAAQASYYRERSLLNNASYFNSLHRGTIPKVHLYQVISSILEQFGSTKPEPHDSSVTIVVQNNKSKLKYDTQLDAYTAIINGLLNLKTPGASLPEITASNVEPILVNALKDVCLEPKKI